METRTRLFRDFDHTQPRQEHIRGTWAPGRDTPLPSKVSPGYLTQVTIEALFTRTRFHLYPHRFRCGYAFRLHGAGRIPYHGTGRFEYAFKSGAFSKRYGFIGRVNGETASI